MISFALHGYQILEEKHNKLKFHNRKELILQLTSFVFQMHVADKLILQNFYSDDHGYMLHS